MSVFYTSDHHFHHKNVLKFENRPYDTIEDMNQGLINVWNNVVKPQDIVHHLGDLCFGGYDKWTSILDRLNGKIILYRGNHDDSKIVKKLVKNGYFENVHEVGGTIKINKYNLWLTHYPMEIGIRPRKYSLHGHIHSVSSRMANQINVGVDNQIFEMDEFGQPITQDRLIDYLDNITPLIEEKFKKDRGLI